LWRGTGTDISRDRDEEEKDKKTNGTVEVVSEQLSDAWWCGVVACADRLSFG
jgi:hypothetical protein